MKSPGLIFVVVLLAGLPFNNVSGQIPSLGGDEMLSDSLTLAEYLDYTAAHNPGLQVEFEHWQDAKSMIAPAKSLPDPMLTYLVEEMETRGGPQRRSLGLMQTFPWPGTLRAQGSAATLAADAAEQRYLAVRLELFSEVKSAWYEFYYLGRAIGITEEHVQLLVLLEEQVRMAYASGIAAQGDVIKAQIELEKMQDMLASLRDQRGPAMAEFNALLNRAADAVMPWPDSLPDMPEMIHENDLVRVLPENPRLQAADFDMQGMKAGWSAARRRVIPELTLGVMVMNPNPTRMTAGEDPGKNPLAFTFSFNLPLWFGKYRAEARGKKANFNAAQQSRVDLGNQMRAAVKRILYQYRDAGRKSGLYGFSLIPKAEQHFEVMLTSFSNGQASFADLIEAQQTLLEFKLNYERARTDRVIQYAELEKLVGRDLSVISTGEIGN
jgi:outer membrane protein TolC